MGKRIEAIEGATVGERIRFRRRALGLLQSDVADEMGWHFTVVSKTESGKRPPTTDELDRLSRVLRCMPRDLIPTVVRRRSRRSPQNPAQPE